MAELTAINSPKQLEHAHIRVQVNKCNIYLLTMRAMLSPSTLLLISGEPKQDAKAISAFPYLATTVSATEFPTASM